MRRPIPSVHSKSHEDRANHPGRSGGPSALTRALDPDNDDFFNNDESMEESYGPYVYDESTGPIEHTRRNRGIEWAPTEYEQEQNRFEKDAMLDAVSDFFKEEK